MTDDELLAKLEEIATGAGMGDYEIGHIVELAAQRIRELINEVAALKVNAT
jgi:hypothetical protein